MCFVAAGVRSCLCVNSTCNLASYYDVVIVVVMCVCARERCERAGEREREREREREKQSEGGGKKKLAQVGHFTTKKIKRPKPAPGWVARPVAPRR